MILNGNVVKVGQIYAFRDNEWEIRQVDTMSCVVWCLYGSWEGTVKQSGTLTVHYTKDERPIDLSTWILVSEPKKETKSTTDIEYMEFDDDIPF